jgi:hypothetical protein
MSAKCLGRKDEENEKSLDKAFRRLGIIICCILM